MTAFFSSPIHGSVVMGSDQEIAMEVLAGWRICKEPAHGHRDWLWVAPNRRCGDVGFVYGLFDRDVQ